MKQQRHLVAVNKSKLYTRGRAEGVHLSSPDFVFPIEKTLRLERRFNG